MTRSGGAASAVMLPPSRSGARAPSRAEIERGIARGRALQGIAMRRAFGPLSRFLGKTISRCSSEAPASLPGRRHSCC